LLPPLLQPLLPLDELLPSPCSPCRSRCSLALTLFFRQPLTAAALNRRVLLPQTASLLCPSSCLNSLALALPLLNHRLKHIGTPQLGRTLMFRIHLLMTGAVGGRSISNCFELKRTLNNLKVQSSF